MGILSSQTHRDVVVEALVVSLQRTLVIASVGGGGQGIGLGGGLTQGLGGGESPP